MARLPSKSDGLRTRRAECRRQSWSESEGGEDESRLEARRAETGDSLLLSLLLASGL